MKSFAAIPPWQAASAYTSTAEAFAAGRATAAGLRRVGAHAAFAPVLDLADGPLGSRQFARPEYGVAFARGLGPAACPKHFPGLGSTPHSTDEARVYGVVRTEDLAPFRAAIRAGVQCVMVGHAIYPRFGSRRASLEPATYRLLRGLGFRGVAITDSLGILAQPLRAVLGAARASCRSRPRADDERARRAPHGRRARAARAAGRARREGRQGAGVPSVVGAASTATVMVAVTVLPSFADRACGQSVRPRALPGRAPAERVGRRDVGALRDAVDQELDARGGARRRDPPDHEAGHLVPRGRSLRDDRERRRRGRGLAASAAAGQRFRLGLRASASWRVGRRRARFGGVRSGRRPRSPRPRGHAPPAVRGPSSSGTRTAPSGRRRRGGRRRGTRGGRPSRPRRADAAGRCRVRVSTTAGRRS